MGDTELQEVKHLDDCMWKLKNIIKTKGWWKTLGLKSCPECNGSLV